MAALGAVASIFSSSSSSSSSKFQFSLKPSPSINLHLSSSTPTFSLNSPFSYFPKASTRKLGFELHFAVQEIAVEESSEQTQEVTQKSKVHVVNLPWSFSVADIKNVFGECGSVKSVEIVKQKNGRNRGFAFITMASEEEASAVVEKFDSYELSGRIIRVAFAKRLKKPSPTDPPVGETRHKLFVSNLAWKVRSSHLREFFSTSSNPVSTRVVFDSPSGRSVGYGFVSFATKEEAEAAISALNGKELLDRPVRLKFSEKNAIESVSEPEEADKAEGQPEEP